MTMRPVLVAFALVAAACDPREAPESMTVLTVSGAVEEVNRPAFDAANDRYFAWLGVNFPRAHTFTRAELRGLPQHRLYVASDAAPPGAYEGPLLSDVLDLAEPEEGSTQLIAYALDGYSAAIPIEAVRRSGAILALRRDGSPLPLGGIGPAIIMFPDDAGADPAWYVWGAVLINVE